MVRWKSRRRLTLAPALALALLCGLTAAVASEEPAAALDKPVEWVGTIKVKTWQENSDVGSSAEYWHETTYTLAPDATFTNEATWSGTVHYSVKSYALNEPCPGLQHWTFYDGTSAGAGVELDVTYSAPQGGYSLTTGITFVPVDVVNRHYDTCTGVSTDSISGSSAPGPVANGPAAGDENAMTLTGELNEGTAALGHSTQWNLRRVNCDEELDTDGGGVGDCLEVDQGTDPANPDDDHEADTDDDGVLDLTDNCPTTPNSDQADLDGDGSGDLCDADIDGDGLSNDMETETGLNPRNPDTDGDGNGDGTDNCPKAPNTDQADTDGDGDGDACDSSPSPTPTPTPSGCRDNRPPTITQISADPDSWLHGTDAANAGVDLTYRAIADDIDGGPLTWRWLFTDSGGTQVRGGSLIAHRWQTSGHPEDRTATAIVTDACGASSSGSMHMSVSGDPVRDFAPLMHLHGDEDFFPMSAKQFIKNSKLVYRHGHRSFSETIAENGDVSGRKLGAGKYRVRVKILGKTRERLTSDDHTRPFDDGTPTVLARGGGIYLDVKNGVRKGSRGGPWPTYVQRSGNKIVYWLFYGLSQPMLSGRASIPSIRHEGDWERVVVKLDDQDVPSRVGYVAHHDPVHYVPYPESFTSIGASGAAAADLSPVGYVALRGHGTYPTAGVTCVGKTPESNLKPVCDYRDNEGEVWDTSNLLVNIHDQSWFGDATNHAKCRAGRPTPADRLDCGYGGGWGDAGELPDTTGPLGPSAFKSATTNG